MRDLLIGFMGEDRAGIVKSLSDAIANNDGSWRESRMVRLAGHFSGTVLIRIDKDKVDSLRNDLAKLDALFTVIRDPVDSQPEESYLMHLNIAGPDRPGIIKEISLALSQQNINVVEMETDVFAAAMSGEVTFAADADIEVPTLINLEALAGHLNEIAEQIGVDILLEAAEEEG